MSEDSLLSRYKTTHESYMKRILATIFSSPYKDIIAFKGGTLAYMHYGLPRFSTDIDLDLLDPLLEQEVLDYMDTTLPSLGEVEKILGRELHRRRFRYDSNAWIIKIELNKRQNTHNVYEVLHIDAMHILCQNCSSMVTNKLLALGERWYNRDLYDIHYFLSKWYTFDEKIVYDRTQQKLSEWINYIIKYIPDYFSETTVLHQLGEVLDVKQKPRVKKHLPTETIKLLQLYLDEIRTI